MTDVLSPGQRGGPRIPVVAGADFGRTMIRFDHTTAEEHPW